MMMDEHDTKQNYCRKLGHEVPFVYCRHENGSLPCARVIDCWFEIFPVIDFIAGHFSEEERTQIFAPPKPKTESLLEIIEKIKKRDSGDVT